MTESLRALLAGAIDYAGMFPPAGLPLEEALAKYRQHRSGPEAWMVGRFVCPGGQLGELGTKFRPEPHSRVAAIVPEGKTVAAIANSLEEFVRQANTFPDLGAVDTLEFRGPTDQGQGADVAYLAEFVVVATRKIVEHHVFPATMYVELVPRRAGVADSEWLRSICDCIRIMVDYKKTSQAIHCPVGVKLRCGGAGPSAIPSSADVAYVLTVCRDARIFWKATAGLHHPFRHVDPKSGDSVHGFINLLTAAVMADIHKLDARQVQAVLEDDDPWHFRFTNEALTWHDLSATVPQIAGARERSLRSFGSCSIDEPWQDLTVLGLL